MAKWCGINGVYKDVDECKRNHAICECGTEAFRRSPPASRRSVMDRDRIYEIVRGTGYVTHAQANEIADLLAPAAAQDEARDALLRDMAEAKPKFWKHDSREVLVSAMAALWAEIERIDATHQQESHDAE